MKKNDLFFSMKFIISKILKSNDAYNRYFYIYNFLRGRNIDVGNISNNIKKIFFRFPFFEVIVDFIHFTYLEIDDIVGNNKYIYLYDEDRLLKFFSIVTRYDNFYIRKYEGFNRPIIKIMESFFYSDDDFFNNVSDDIDIRKMYFLYRICREKGIKLHTCINNDNFEEFVRKCFPDVDENILRLLFYSFNLYDISQYEFFLLLLECRHINESIDYFYSVIDGLLHDVTPEENHSVEMMSYFSKKFGFSYETYSGNFFNELFDICLGNKKVLEYIISRKFRLHIMMFGFFKIFESILKERFDEDIIDFMKCIPDEHYYCYVGDSTLTDKDMHIFWYKFSFFIYMIISFFSCSDINNRSKYQILRFIKKSFEFDVLNNDVRVRLETFPSMFSSESFLTKSLMYHDVDILGFFDKLFSENINNFLKFSYSISKTHNFFIKNYYLLNDSWYDKRGTMKKIMKYIVELYCENKIEIDYARIYSSISNLIRKFLHKGLILDKNIVSVILSKKNIIKNVDIIL